MFDILRRMATWFSSRPKPAAVRHRAWLDRRRLFARYDAAVTTDENRKHWAAADNLGPLSANSAAIRQTLRARARYEVANNSYAKGIVLTLANDLIGTGPRLQVMLDSPGLGRWVERRWSEWSKAVGLPGKLRTVVASKVTDGEVFIALQHQELASTPIRLNIQLIEADRVSSPWPADDPSVIDGIAFDTDGNPVSYYVLRHHPGDVATLPVGKDAYVVVPADRMIHYFRADRPGQIRGVPEITPALPLFAQLRRYTLAVLAAAETAADLAAVLYTDSPPGGEVDAAEPFETIEIEKRSIMTLPGGWKISQLAAEQPATRYAEFKRELLNEIARCLNMPFNVAACNSSDYNYASGRLDYQVYQRSLRVERSVIEAVILEPILRQFLDEAALIERPEVLERWPERFNYQWFWDGHEHVDPAKEANAQSVKLASNTTTLAYEYAKQGIDWEDALRQRAKEVALLKELGLIQDGDEDTAWLMDDADDDDEDEDQPAD